MEEGSNLLAFTDGSSVDIDFLSFSRLLGMLKAFRFQLVPLRQVI